MQKIIQAIIMMLVVIAINMITVSKIIITQINSSLSLMHERKPLDSCSIQSLQLDSINL